MTCLQLYCPKTFYDLPFKHPILMDPIFEKMIKKHNLNFTKDGKDFLYKIYNEQMNFVKTILEKETEEDFFNTIEE